MIRPDRCEQCEKPCKPDGAHYNYAEPLRVRWLCAQCHRKWDTAEPKSPQPTPKGVNSRSGFITTRAAAIVWNVSPATVARWCNEGLIEAIRLPGGQYRIDPRAIDALLAQLPPREEVPAA